MTYPQYEWPGILATSEPRQLLTQADYLGNRKLRMQTTPTPHVNAADELVLFTRRAIEWFETHQGVQWHTLEFRIDHDPLNPHRYPETWIWEVWQTKTGDPL